jgi:hypothetical protein
VKEELAKVQTNASESLARTGFTSECEAAINEQIK